MKLLICTQKIDMEDPILGFFHRWVEEFAKHFEFITVICLYEGKHTLPQNVRVLSLGKESGVSRFKYLIRFYKYIWNERKNYTAVFVHMNQEYVLLGAFLWKVLRKRIVMWRNHHFGNIFTRIAVLCSDRVFCTSKYSFTAQFKKTVLMPVGIDINRFRRDDTIPRIPNSILFLGRISPVKNVDIFMDALKLLDKKGTDFVANIYGDALEIDRTYHERIKKSARELEDSGKIIFHKAVPNYKTPQVYNQNEIFVNLTETGSFDKTILEAATCECIITVSNKSCKNILPKELIFKEKNPEDLAEKLGEILQMPLKEKEKYQKLLYENAKQHNISILARKINDEISRL